MKDVTILIKFKAFQHLADKNNRITQLQQHTLRHNNSGIVNEDSQYQMHDLGPDQNGQSMTVTK